MFEVKNNQQIGKYLSKLIDGKFEAKRKFCIAYLEKNHEDKNDDSLVRNMQNRVSQMIKGKKAIQTKDLPIFTELLDVTCEAILSAGEYSVQKSNRSTNYSIAFSKSPKEWESYINREDKLFLNQDEYGKNVIDYSLECNNYEFLKYLVDNNYIWFVGENDKSFKYTLNFGAGTSIERRQFYGRDSLELKLAQETDLRSKMISLAIDNKDIVMLIKLKAREIPSLYGTSFLGLNMPDCNKYYNEEMIEHIAASNNEKIISYFAEEFEVNALYDKKYVFVFPYLSELTEQLLKNKSRYADLVLVKAIDHNKNTYEKLKKLIATAYVSHRKSYNWVTDENRLKKLVEKDIAKELNFYKNGQIINFRQMFTPNIKSSNIDGITTNIVNIKWKSNNTVTQHFIDEANYLFEKIQDLIENPIPEEM